MPTGSPQPNGWKPVQHRSFGKVSGHLIVNLVNSAAGIPPFLFEFFLYLKICFVK
jgi:hypothetical protein